MKTNFDAANAGMVNAIAGLAGLSFNDTAAFKPAVCLGFDAVQDVSYGNEGPKHGMHIGQP